MVKVARGGGEGWSVVVMSIVMVPGLTSGWTLGSCPGWGDRRDRFPWYPCSRCLAECLVCSLCSFNIYWFTTWTPSLPPHFNYAPSLFSSPLPTKMPFYCCAVDKRWSLETGGLRFGIKSCHLLAGYLGERWSSMSSLVRWGALTPTSQAVTGVQWHVECNKTPGIQKVLVNIS